MTRLQLEHVIRAAAAIANDPDIVVIGSQAVLGQFPDAPGELLFSMEADVYPRFHPERSDLIDGSMGEGSPFQNTFGYFAHGVDPATAILPAGWEGRLIQIANPNTAGARGGVSMRTILRSRSISPGVIRISITPNRWQTTEWSIGEFLSRGWR